MPAAGAYRFRFDACHDRQLQLELSNAEGALLASTYGSTEPCPALEYDVPGPGSYALFVDMLGGTSAGSFYLSADPVAP